MRGGGAGDLGCGRGCEKLLELGNIWSMIRTVVCWEASPRGREALVRTVPISVVSCSHHGCLQATRLTANDAQLALLSRREPAPAHCGSAAEGREARTADRSRDCGPSSSVAVMTSTEVVREDGAAVGHTWFCSGRVHFQMHIRHLFYKFWACAYFISFKCGSL